MKNYFDEVMIRLSIAKDRIRRLTEIQNEEDEQSKQQRALSK